MKTGLDGILCFQDFKIWIRNRSMMYINFMGLNFGGFIDSFILHHFLEQNVEYRSSINNHESWFRLWPVTVVLWPVPSEYKILGFSKLAQKNDDTVIWRKNYGFGVPKMFQLGVGLNKGRMKVNRILKSSGGSDSGKDVARWLNQWIGRTYAPLKTDILSDFWTFKLKSDVISH